MSEPHENVNVEYPVDVRLTLRESKEEFALELKMLAAVKLYELGKIFFLPELYGEVSGRGWRIGVR